MATEGRRNGTHLWLQLLQGWGREITKSSRSSQVTQQDFSKEPSYSKTTTGFLPIAWLGTPVQTQWTPCVIFH